MQILITAGPTREPIDEVRFISNRSSGRMGVAIADAAARAGHDVTLLMGPGPRDDELPNGSRNIRFSSSADLEALLAEHFPDCDLLIMAAAVADYRPAAVTTGKLASDKTAGMSIELKPTPDLVAGCASRKQPQQRVVAFALEEAAQLEARAVAKMQRKGVDAIVANPLATMDAGDIDATVFFADGRKQPAGRRSKTDFADWLVDALTH